MYIIFNYNNTKTNYYMVLIISENSDQSTNHVIDWLISYDIPFLRLNETDYINVVKVELTNKCKSFIFNINRKENEYDLFNIEHVWYRRGRVQTDNILDFDEIALRNVTNLKFDIDGLRDFFINYLQDLPSLGNFNHNINKLYVIKKALDFKLNVPDAYCFKNVGDIYKKSSTENYITKSIQKSLVYEDDTHKTQCYTEHIKSSDLDNYKGINKIPISFIQKQIIKACDVRVFYLFGNFYSMGIFSQNNIKTSVDFRKYDNVKPNRRVPFQLPIEVESSLKNLFNYFNINCCSTDLILDKSNTFWFLEINPVGQFNMVSSPCNYNLEQKLALAFKNN